jgi:iron(III) transport system substrate-binding protein
MSHIKAVAALVVLVLAAPAAAEDFSLEKLIEAARAEPPLTIYDNTSKVKKMAKAFAAKYGLEAVGVKVRSPQQVELVTREAEAGAIQGDVVALADVAAGQLELLPQGILVSWLPPDLADKVPARFQNPLVLNNDPDVFAYNTETDTSCPIDNIWALTEPEMKGRVAMTDPLNDPSEADFFNQLQTQADKTVAAAYEARYGKPLETKEASATAAWVAALAANGPLLTESHQAISDAVGAPGQKKGLIGIMSSAKFRDNKGQGYKLGLCTDVKPIAGFAKPKLILMSPKTDSPNAAKLYIHYAMTPEGLAPQTIDGKMPVNVDAKLPADEPSGVAKIAGDLLFFDAATASDDFDRRQDWQDLWRVNYKR